MFGFLHTIFSVANAGKEDQRSLPECNIHTVNQVRLRKGLHMLTQYEYEQDEYNYDMWYIKNSY